MENYNEFELNGQKFKVTYKNDKNIVWNADKSTWRQYPDSILGNSKPCKYNVKFQTLKIALLAVKG